MSITLNFMDLFYLIGAISTVCFFFFKVNNLTSTTKEMAIEINKLSEKVNNLIVKAEKLDMIISNIEKENSSSLFMGLEHRRVSMIKGDEEENIRKISNNDIVKPTNKK